jgi:hypothetical protein
VTTSIVFVKPTHHYQSYDDFWRLVEVSGFPVISFGDVDLDDDITYIFTPWNGEAADVLPRMRAATDGRPRGRIVWWNLERDLADASEDERATRVAACSLLVDDIWVSDRHYASLHKDFKHVVLGGHPSFADPRTILFRGPMQWSATLYAYVWGRRQLIADALLGNSHNLAPDAWAQENRAHVLAHTEVMVNTHQYDNAKIVAPIRFAVAASYGMPLISEPLEDPYPLKVDEHYFEAPTERLGPSIRGLSGHHAWWGMNLYDLLVVEHRFDKGVRAAVLG